MEYRVFIPTAGLGSRLEGLAKNINKSLVSIANKPAISYIVEKFDKQVEFVIALGYKGDTVREFLSLAYPDRKFHFQKIDKFEGEGSGLGYTLLQCRHLLQMPFLFCSNDTIVEEDIKPPSHNWMGYTYTEDNSQYRSIRIKNRNVTEICAKGAEGDVRAYIGLAGIYDYELFWKAMAEGVNQGAIEIGESFGLRFLMESSIEPVEFTWFDTGNLDALDRTQKHFLKNVDAKVLDKEDEAIWILNNKVIKFSTDEDFIRNRVARAGTLNGFVPPILSSTTNMYAYDKVPGEVFSRNPTLNYFKYFLSWMEKFWTRERLAEPEANEFKGLCMNFYRDKTYSRVKQYFRRFEQLDSEEIINGEKVPRIYALLDQIGWDWIADGLASRFHGDLHFENILINDYGKSPFTLLDWRQDFAGNLKYGDIYYDFAKLNHGLIMSHELVDQKLFNVNHKLNEIRYDFLRKQSLVDCENYFRDWIDDSGYDYKKVRMLTALIYLNIAALHHYPYSLLLFYLGKTMLNELLYEN